MSLCAQIRAGILRLHIETGRYMGLAEEDRVCGLRHLQKVENEVHFLFYCPFYHALRENLFSKIDRKNEIIWLDDSEKLNYLFTFETFKFASYIEKAWQLRRRAMYL